MTEDGAAERPVSFPPPESEGGWQILGTDEEVLRVAGMDPGRLAYAWDEQFLIGRIVDAIVSNGSAR
jgi:hypothetical protein